MEIRRGLHYCAFVGEITTWTGLRSYVVQGNYECFLLAFVGFIFYEACLVSKAVVYLLIS